jgi:putative DNA primase/helicase
LSLAAPEGREQVESCLSDISLLILDSITTLCSGAGPENDSESWEDMQGWLLELRRQGIATLLAHHDGKGLKQRGTSRREDVLSTVVQLRRPSDYSPREGARFELHYTKSRGIVGEAAEPFEARLDAGPDGGAQWTWRPLEDAQGIRAEQLAAEGLKQREIAEELGVGLGTVNRLLKRRREAD